MPAEPAVSVVIPVYNEKESLPLLYRELMDALEPLSRPFEIIFVNDGSRDGSEEVLDGLAEDSRVKVIHFRRNYGQSAALMAGFDHASGEVVVSMDADLQNDPADIPAMLEKVNEGVTVVSGWRKNRQDRAVTRKLPSFFANRLISAISGVKLHDYGCTLKAYRRELIQDLGIYGEMHRFLPIYAKWKGARIEEMPVNHRARAHGQSKYGLERTFKVLLDLLLIKFYDSFSAKPMYAFGAIGFLSVFTSIFFFLLMIYFKYWGGKSFIETPLPLLAVQFFLIGVMCFLLGITADMVMRTYFESQRLRPYLISRGVNIQTNGEAKTN